MNWVRVKLEEIAEEKRENYEPNTNERLNYIGLEHIEQQTLRLTAIGESNVTISSKRKFNTGDILFGSLRPYFRKVYKPKFNGVCSTDITVIQSKKNFSQDYLFYLIANQPFIDYATNYSNGTRMPRANWKVISKSEWSVPREYNDQQKIASILTAYDHLIENNTRRIKILEETAQTIYKEWFVNFRFPGNEKVKFIESPLGKIPEGWEAVEVRDIVKRLKAGNVYTEKAVNIEGDVIVIDQSTKEYLGFHNNEPDHNASPENPIIIFGDHTCKMQIMVEPFSVGPNVVPFTTNGKTTTQFLFYLVNELVETKEYKRHWNELIVKKVMLPLLSIQEEFSRVVTSNLEMIDTLKIKNQNLRKTRDLILPKLMSGEVEV